MSDAVKPEKRFYNNPFLWITLFLVAMNFYACSQCLEKQAAQKADEERRADAFHKAQAEYNAALKKDAPWLDFSRSLSMEKYETLKPGMDYGEVFRTIGWDGRLVSEAESDGLQCKYYEWKGSNGGVIRLMLQNGKLDTKVQSGLY